MMMIGKRFGMLAVYKRPDDMSEDFDVENLQLFNITMDNHTELVNNIVNAVIRFLDDLQKTLKK